MTGILARLWWRMRLWALRTRAWTLRRDEGWAILHLASEAAQRHDFARFFRAVDLAGGLSRWGAETLAWAAQPYYEAGRTLEAAGLLAVALEKEPKSAAVLGCYGVYLQKEGKYQQSAEYLEEAHAAEPHDAWTLSRLGDTYRCLGEWEQARERYLEALRQGPSETDTGFVYSGLAHVAAQQSDWDEAARCWQEAAARLPMDEEIWYNLGDALLQSGHYREAIEALGKNLRLGSTLPAWTFYDLASSYHQLGDVPRARRYCEQALRNVPDDQDAQELMREIEASKA
jgi:tetratricopeptide (TPR) repeat protein